jgi:hypothetical protein
MASILTNISTFDLFADNKSSHNTYSAVNLTHVDHCDMHVTARGEAHAAPSPGAGGAAYAYDSDASSDSDASYKQRGGAAKGAATAGRGTRNSGSRVISAGNRAIGRRRSPGRSHRRSARSSGLG